MLGGQHLGQHPVATLHPDASPGVKITKTPTLGAKGGNFSPSLWTMGGEWFGKGSFQPGGQEVPGIKEPEVRVLDDCPGQSISEGVMAESSGICLGLSSETMPQMGKAPGPPRHWAAKKAQLFHPG